jgi:hypothetical protein
MSTHRLNVQSRHYEYVMSVKHNITPPLHTVQCNVRCGNKNCLDVQITLENLSSNDRFDIHQNSAVINRVESHKSCITDKGYTEDYIAAHSIGQELLKDILYYIHINYPSITRIKLNDMSSIPCSPVESLDLITYSIALYGKTWYEQKMGAYIENKQKYVMYRGRVERYMSKETKASLSWIDMLGKMTPKSKNIYMDEMLQKHAAKWEELFNKSETLPLFFIELSKHIPRAKKCIFFKGWLEAMIKSYVSPIEDIWMIEVEPLIDAIRANGIPTFNEINSGGNIRKKNTRKRKHSVRRYRRTSRHQTG